MFLSRYIQAIKSPNVSYISSVELLDEKEVQSKSILIDLIDSSGSVKISFQNGVRRTASVTLDNSDNKYDIDVGKLWIYQKFKISTGIEFVNELGELETMLFPQGVFYINNPQRVYNPSLKTIVLEGIDKWSRLNGKLGGTLGATYVFPKRYKDENGVERTQDYNMFDIIRNLLKTPIRSDVRNIAFIPTLNESADINNQINRFLTLNGFEITEIRNREAVTINNSGTVYYCDNFPKEVNGVKVSPTWKKLEVNKDMVLDNLEPILNNWFLTDDKLGIARILAPYSITKKMGSYIENILLEINTILGGNIYYNRVGRLELEPTQDQIEDNDKEVVWSFSDEEDNILYDFQESYDFEGIYNHIVAQGTIVDSGTYTVWVQNQNPISPVSIDKIGTKTIIYDNLGTYDYRHFMEKKQVDKDVATNMVKDTLREYAEWLLKRHVSQYNTATIKCYPLPHLDVNQVVRVTTNGVTKKFLITGIDMPLNATDSMSLSLVAVYEPDSLLVGLS